MVPPLVVRVLMWTDTIVHGFIIGGPPVPSLHRASGTTSTRQQKQQQQWVWLVPEKKANALQQEQPFLSKGLVDDDLDDKYTNTNDTEQQQQQQEATVAQTGTVNERLLAELQQASELEQYGRRSPLSLSSGSVSKTNQKTQAERLAAMEASRDLNGVNPVVALLGGAFCLLCAAGLWIVTQHLAEVYAQHPIVVSDMYIVARVTAVMRNVLIGLSALASGFFGVTGVGLFLLAMRVSYGILQGELDPTPIKKSVSSKETEAIDLATVWDLMTNKSEKRGRR